MRRREYLLLVLMVVLVLIAGLLTRATAQEPVTVTSDRVRIASWNIRIFSDRSRDDTELDQICRTLIDYDLIALIELRDEAVLQRTEAMLETMGKDYDYQVSAEIGRGVKERYVFLYDTSKIEAVEAGKAFPDPDDVFIREPYYATFRAGKFDFTVIAVHIIWGEAVDERRAEIQSLAGVYNQVQEMDTSEQDVILVGDFNCEPNDEESYTPLRSIPFMVSLFSLPQKSHIRDTSLYDNIWFQTSYLSEYTGISGIDRFDETDFGNDDDAASLAVSDHRPVWAEFYTDKDDDGLQASSNTKEGQSQGATWGQIKALHEKISYLQAQIDVLTKRLDMLEEAIAKIERTRPTLSDERQEEPQPAEDDVMVYITTTGKKYHRAGCSYLKRSAIPIKKSEAVKRGYTPCSRCNP